MKKIILLLTGILTFQLAFSQENYIPGYVIKNNNDTLFGFVDYRNWGKNPNKIYFKTQIENNPILYGPTDIIEFKVEGEIYVSGIVNTEVSPIETKKLKEDPQLNIKEDTTFLQTLFSGEKSLYYYKNTEGRENYYIKHNAGFDLLIFKMYLKQYDDKLLISKNKIYLGQLTLYLNNCETINTKIENTSYSKKSLIKLFNYYYKCSSSAISFQKEKEKIQTEIGILTGVSLSSLEFHSVYSVPLAYHIKEGYNPSINFSSGIFFDLILPRNQGKWSINNEILFSTYKVTGSYEEYENENVYSVITTKFGYSYLKINNLARFKYPIGHLQIFLNGGMSNGFSLNETNYKKKDSKLYTTDKIIEELALKDTRKYEQGFIIGTGVKNDRFSLEIRYEIGNGMSEYSTLNSITKRYYVLLGYRFKITSYNKM